MDVGWMNGSWIDGWVLDSWMDGWMDERMDVGQ